MIMKKITRWKRNAVRKIKIIMRTKSRIDKPLQRTQPKEKGNQN